MPPTAPLHTPNQPSAAHIARVLESVTRSHGDGYSVHGIETIETAGTGDGRVVEQVVRTLGEEVVVTIRRKGDPHYPAMVLDDGAPATISSGPANNRGEPLPGPGVVSPVGTGFVTAPRPTVRLVGTPILDDDQRHPDLDDLDAMAAGWRFGGVDGLEIND